MALSTPARSMSSLRSTQSSVVSRETWTCSYSAAAFMEQPSIMREMTSQRTFPIPRAIHSIFGGDRRAHHTGKGCAQVGRLFRPASRPVSNGDADVPTRPDVQAAHLPRAAAGSRRDNHKFTWRVESASSRHVSRPHGGLCRPRRTKCGTVGVWLWVVSW